MTGDKDSVRSRFNVREVGRITLRRKNAGGINESAKITIQDSDRFVYWPYPAASQPTDLL